MAKGAPSRSNIIPRLAGILITRKLRASPCPCKKERCKTVKSIMRQSKMPLNARKKIPMNPNRIRCLSNFFLFIQSVF